MNAFENLRRRNRYVDNLVEDAKQVRLHDVLRSKDRHFLQASFPHLTNDDFEKVDDGYWRQLLEPGDADVRSYGRNGDKRRSRTLEALNQPEKIVGQLDGLVRRNI